MKKTRQNFPRRILRERSKKLHTLSIPADNNLRSLITMKKEEINLKATGIVRRIDDLGRVVIPKEIRRTLRIREGDPLQISLLQSDAKHAFLHTFLKFAKKIY